MAAWLARAQRSLWRGIEDGSIVVFDERTGRAFALNPAAARVWCLCDGTRTADEIVARAGGDASGVSAAAAPAVAALLDRWRELGLVVESAERAARPDAPPPEVGPQAEPVCEEIVFGACDCGGGARGLVRSYECDALGQPQTAVSAP